MPASSLLRNAATCVWRCSVRGGRNPSCLPLDVCTIKHAKCVRRNSQQRMLTPRPSRRRSNNTALLVDTNLHMRIRRACFTRQVGHCNTIWPLIQWDGAPTCTPPSVRLLRLKGAPHSTPAGAHSTLPCGFDQAWQSHGKACDACLLLLLDFSYFPMLHFPDGWCTSRFRWRAGRQQVASAAQAPLLVCAPAPPPPPRPPCRIDMQPPNGLQLVQLWRSAWRKRIGRAGVANHQQITNELWTHWRAN